MKRLSEESGKLREELGKEKSETSSLREVVRTQEEDLSLIRQNILAKTRQMNAKNSPESPSASKAPAPAAPSSSTLSTATGLPSRTTGSFILHSHNVFKSSL